MPRGKKELAEEALLALSPFALGMLLLADYSLKPWRPHERDVSVVIASEAKFGKRLSARVGGTGSDVAPCLGGSTNRLGSASSGSSQIGFTPVGSGSART